MINGKTNLDASTGHIITFYSLLPPLPLSLSFNLIYKNWPDPIYNYCPFASPVARVFRNMLDAFHSFNRERFTSEMRFQNKFHLRKNRTASTEFSI